MNRELIKKYKKEFDYWLDNPDNLLFKSNIDKESKWRKFDDSGDDWTWTHHYNDKVQIVINDEYVEFRKAIIEGKTIQYYDCVFQHELCVNLDKYDWIDLSIATSSFTFSDKLKYRIKPEEPKFKAGDFIRQTKELGINVSRIYRIKAHISDILYSVEENIYDVDAINAKEEYFELWKPYNKELCYFTHDTNTKTSATLREFREISEDGFYVDCFGTRYIYCEPFLNSKPSWFKD